MLIVWSLNKWMKWMHYSVTQHISNSWPYMWLVTLWISTIYYIDIYDWGGSEYILKGVADGHNLVSDILNPHCRYLNLIYRYMGWQTRSSIAMKCYNGLEHCDPIMREWLQHRSATGVNYLPVYTGVNTPSSPSRYNSITLWSVHCEYAWVKVKAPCSPLSSWPFLWTPHE